VSILKHIQLSCLVYEKEYQGNKFLGLSIQSVRRHSEKISPDRSAPGIFVTPLRLFGKKNPGRRYTK